MSLHFLKVFIFPPRYLLYLEILLHPRLYPSSVVLMKISKRRNSCQICRGDSIFGLSRNPEAHCFILKQASVHNSPSHCDPRQALASVAGLERQPKQVTGDKLMSTPRVWRTSNVRIKHNRYCKQKVESCRLWLHVNFPSPVCCARVNHIPSGQNQLVTAAALIKIFFWHKLSWFSVVFPSDILNF